MKDPKRVGDQCGTPRNNVKKIRKSLCVARKELQKWNRGKCVQVDDLKDMYVKN